MSKRKVFNKQSKKLEKVFQLLLEVRDEMDNHENENAVDFPYGLIHSTVDIVGHIMDHLDDMENNE